MMGRIRITKVEHHEANEGLGVGVTTYPSTLSGHGGPDLRVPSIFLQWEEPREGSTVHAYTLSIPLEEAVALAERIPVEVARAEAHMRAHGVVQR